MNRILTRSGEVRPSDAAQDKALSALYRTVPGRAVLSVLTKPVISALGGAVLDSSLSTAVIPWFAERYQIPMSDYEPTEYTSYNSFFTRKARADARPVDSGPDVLISPCDAKLSVYPITSDSRFIIKQSSYSTADLLGCKRLAKRFCGGQCLIFRLTVEDYHRYCYFDDGTKGKNRFLGGELHTVNPIALEHCNIYKRNCRSVTLLHTARFGTAAQIEVGALMVGKIINHHEGSHTFVRGEEKGMFAFGGSTVVLLLEPGRAEIDADILRNSQNGDETIVRYGSRIGTVEKIR
ncbi:MAG: phosphatidylserine decarboxylase [Ruminococcus sp.]|nr:phosphatidylserine decarboxylase [Ruminococcus sp.]